MSEKGFMQLHLLIDALIELDSMINQDLEIIAVGGFALMIQASILGRNIRGSNDIDDVNNYEFSDELLSNIAKVGISKGLMEDWLNTQSFPYYRDGNGSPMFDKGDYEFVDLKLAHIRLNVLNLVRQLRGKFDSIEANGFGYRLQDEEDVFTILKLLGISSIESTICHPELAFIFNSYPEIIINWLKRNEFRLEN